MTRRSGEYRAVCKDARRIVPDNLRWIPCSYTLRFADGSSRRRKLCIFSTEEEMLADLVSSFKEDFKYQREAIEADAFFSPEEKASGDRSEELVKITITSMNGIKLKTKVVITQ